MEYIVIPSKSRTETAFFMSLLKKMQKEVTMFSSTEMEDLAFMKAIKEGEKTETVSLENIKRKLSKIGTNK